MTSPPPRAREWALVTLAALVLGAVDALLLKGFEWLVDHGTDWIWDGLLDTDDDRWRVVPLALVLGLALAGLLVITRQPRLPPPKTTAVSADDEDDDAPPPTLASLAVVGVVGLVSLVAGASLGPEAALVAMTAGLGLWTGQRFGNGPLAKLLQLASIGALLVAFLGSIVPVLIPLLLLVKRKQLSVFTGWVVVVASAASFATLWLVDRSTSGWGSIPVGTSTFAFVDVLVALVVGFLAAIFGWLLKLLILSLHRGALWFDRRVAWPVAGALFGLVLGLLYLIGGPTVEFSGSAGTGLLLERQPPYGTATLFVVLGAKLAATAWSIATGYRGGLVFPSVFAGVTVALIALSLVDKSGPGVVIGAIAGVFAAMTGPAVALIFVAALIPVKMLPIAIVGIVGAVVGVRLSTRWSPPAPADAVATTGAGTTA